MSHSVALATGELHLRAIVSADSLAVAMLRMILNIPGRTGRGASVFPSHAPGRHPVLEGERRILA